MGSNSSRPLLLLLLLLLLLGWVVLLGLQRRW